MVHVTGLAWTGGYGEPADSATEIRDITYASGAAMAVRAETLPRARRLHRASSSCTRRTSSSAGVRGSRACASSLDPGADVYHEYEFARNAAKHYFLERNRLVFVLTAYSAGCCRARPGARRGRGGAGWRWPQRGLVREKRRGWGWCVRERRWLLRHRRETQRLRRVADRERPAC